MRPGSLIASIFFLIVIFEPVAALSSPAGVWVSGNANSVIERIHIVGPPFNYTATIDYRCAMGVCSTLQSLIGTMLLPRHIQCLSKALVRRRCSNSVGKRDPRAIWQSQTNIRSPSGPPNQERCKRARLDAFRVSFARRRRHPRRAIDTKRFTRSRGGRGKGRITGRQ